MGAFASTFSLALIVGPWLGATMLDRVGRPGDVGWQCSSLGLFAAGPGRRRDLARTANVCRPRNRPSERLTRTVDNTAQADTT